MSMTENCPICEFKVTPFETLSFELPTNLTQWNPKWNTTLSDLSISAIQFFQKVEISSFDCDDERTYQLAAKLQHRSMILKELEIPDSEILDYHQTIVEIVIGEWRIQCLLSQVYIIESKGDFVFPDSHFTLRDLEYFASQSAIVKWCLSPDRQDFSCHLNWWPFVDHQEERQKILSRSVTESDLEILVNRLLNNIINYHVDTLHLTKNDVAESFRKTIYKNCPPIHPNLIIETVSMILNIVE
jgi:hypothetical protein